MQYCPMQATLDIFRPHETPLSLAETSLTIAYRQHHSTLLTDEG